MRALTALFLSLTVQLASAQANYTKTTEIPPLRVAFADLQAVIDKTEKLVSSANAGARPRREELVLKSGVIQITIPGRTLALQNAKIPEKIDSFTYTYSMADRASVTQVSLDFSDYRRTLMVEGSSPEQVDAIFAATQEDLMNISSAIGGSGIKTLLGFPAYLILMTIMGWIGSDWYSTRSARSLGILISAMCVMLLLALLPTASLLAGFLAIRGEPSFMIRYGPEISFIGLILAVVGIPLSVSQLFGASKKNNKTPEAAPAEQLTR